MSLFIQMPVVETKFEFGSLLAEYGKLKGEIVRLEERSMQIECALHDFAEKALKVMNTESEVEK